MLQIDKKDFRRIVSAAFAAACLTVRGAASSLDDALALCRRTYEYVAKSIPANEAKRFAQEMAVDAKWAATAKTPAERAIVEKVVRRLRRDADRVIFAFCDHTRKPEADAEALKVPKVDPTEALRAAAMIHANATAAGYGAADTTFRKGVKTDEA